MTERMIEANGVELCTEPFGDPADPPILLVMGIGASMLWWEEGFCRMLAGGERFVIRYDHRDTGRSITYQLGRPGYTGTDLVADAAGVLDAYRIPAAHVVGAVEAMTGWWFIAGVCGSMVESRLGAVRGCDGRRGCCPSGCGETSPGPRPRRRSEIRSRSGARRR